MIAALLNDPIGTRDLDHWAFHNDDSHRQIAIAIQAKYSQNILVRPLYPLPRGSLQDWMNWHQDAHDQMSAILGIQSSSVGGVDFRDPIAVKNFTRLHFLEHYEASNMLGLG